MDVLVKVILLADAVSLRGHVEARTLHMPTDSFASPSHGLDARLDQLSRDLATERRRRRRLEKGVLALALIAISATFLLILQDLGLATTSTCAGPSCRATLADICLSRGTDGTPFAVEGARGRLLDSY